MISLLIANSDLSDAKRIVNITMKKNKEIRLIDISTNIEEAMETINEEFPEIIIINRDLKNITKYINKIFYNPVFVHSHRINSPDDLHEAIKKVNSARKENIIEEKKNNKSDFNIVRKKVWDILLKLNFNPKMKGTTYLADCVALAYLNNNINSTSNMSKDLYPHVAERHGSTGESVKWDIIKAINAMNSYNIDNNPELLATFFELTTDVKATPKFFVNNLVNII